MLKSEWRTQQPVDPWQDSQDQLARAAGRLGLAPELHDRLARCELEVTTQFLVRFDDGAVRVLTGYRVRHSTARGPAKGGIRYAPDLSLAEARALAMTMTWKSALLGLPFGGGKGGVVCDPSSLSAAEKERLTKQFTKAIAPVIGPAHDILAPDLGTDAQTMAWIEEAYSEYSGVPAPAVVTGKPGTDEIASVRRRATGHGVAVCVREAIQQFSGNVEQRTAIVQGFGNVGASAALVLREYGLRIVGISDVTGAVYNASGLDLAGLQRYVADNGGVAGFPGGEPLHGSELLEQPCDVLVPAATGGQLHGGNARAIQARIIAEGANGPTTPEADELLRQRGVLIIPDLVCNAGGVLISYLEWLRDTGAAPAPAETALIYLESTLARTYRAVAQAAAIGPGDLRAAALDLAVARTARAVAEQEGIA